MGAGLSSVGPYRIERLLGTGGMGAVYLGRDRAGAPAAVKLIRPEHVADRRFRARLRREVDAAARVPRFCTAAVLDADLDAEQPWIATEYIDAPTLDVALLERGALRGRDLVAFAAGVAVALRAIHEHGVVHRDLKPSNVLLAPDGVRVIDFGVARIDDSALTRLTQTGVQPGTPAFMAPEQVRGRPVTPAVDVYAWAALVWYAATRRPPPDAGARPDLAVLPASLRSPVSEALADAPAARPSAAQLVARLSRAERPVTTRVLETATAAPAARPTLPPTRIAAPATPPPSLLREAAVLLAPSVAAAARRGLALLRLPVLAVVTAAAAVAAVAAMAVSIDPSGGDGSAEDPQDPEVVIPECGQTPVFGCQIRGPFGRDAGHGVLVVGRLDGNPVAVSGAGGSVNVWDLRTGQPLRTIPAHPEPVTNLAIAERDGVPVIVSAMHEQPTGFEGADRELAVWDLRTGGLVGGPFTAYAGFAVRIAIRQLDGAPVLVAYNTHVGEARVWRLDRGDLAGEVPPLWAFGLAAGSARTIELAEVGGATVVVAADDDVVRLVDPVTGGEFREPLRGHTAAITSVRIGQLDGRPVVVSGGDDDTVRAWDLAAGEAIGPACEVGSAWTVQLSTAYRPDLVAVVLGRNGTVELCDLTSGEILAELPAGHPGMPSLAIGELDGTPIGVSVGDGGTLRLWSLELDPERASPTGP